jgi:hypothetical protein
MANTAISGLTASASNAAATDVLPVVQTTGVGPVKMTVQQMAGGLLGSTTLSGATITADAPVLNMSQTWNNGAVTFTGLKFNAAGTSDANSAAASLLMDLQVNTASKFSIAKNGNIEIASSAATITTVPAANNTLTISANGTNTFLQVNHGAQGVSVRGNGTDVLLVTRLSGLTVGSLAPRLGFTASDINVPDAFLSRRAAANLRLGAADTTGTTAPTPQFLSAQSWLSSTTNNQTGANFTIDGSQGTGTGAGGSIIFRVAPAGGTGTAQNALATALTLTSAGTLVFPNSGTPATLIQFQYANYGIGSNANGEAVININSAARATIGVNARLGPIGTYAWGSTDSNSASDLILARDAANTLALRNGTNAQEMRVYETTTGTIYKAILGNRQLIKIAGAAFDDGAGASAGTLTNAPAVGNPTKWIPIDDNGTTRHIPAW